MRKKTQNNQSNIAVKKPFIGALFVLYFSLSGVCQEWKKIEIDQNVSVMMPNSSVFQEDGKVMSWNGRTSVGNFEVYRTSYHDTGPFADSTALRAFYLGSEKLAGDRGIKLLHSEPIQIHGLIAQKSIFLMEPSEKQKKEEFWGLFVDQVGYNFACEYESEFEANPWLIRQRETFFSSIEIAKGLDHGHQYGYANSIWGILRNGFFWMVISVVLSVGMFGFIFYMIKRRSKKTQTSDQSVPMVK